MKFFFGRLRPYRGRLALMGCLEFVSAVCTLLLPYFMTSIVDEGIRLQDMRAIAVYAAIMAALSIVSLAAAAIVAKESAQVGASLAAELQKDIFRKVNSLTFEAYASVGTSSFLTRQTQDVDIFRDVATSMAYFVVNIPVFFIGGGVLAFLADWTLALIMLAAIPVILLLVSVISRRVGPLWELTDKMFDKQNAIVRERLAGIRVIRAFDKENFEHARVSRATNVMSDAIVKANIMSGLLNPCCLFLINAVTVAIVAVGAMKMTAQGMLSAGDVVASMQYTALMANGVLNISWLLVWFPELRVSLRRIAEIFSLESAEIGQNGKKRRGRLEVRGLTFSYGGAPALEGVDFSLDEGEIVGIIGGTGAGKTTLVKLLLGFYENYEGELFLDGVSYRSADKADLRASIAVALQKSMIFEGTAASNIKMGNAAASDEEMRRAAQIAQIDDFFSAQKDGYDHRLSQMGTNISGGQKQRVNIARTILKDASVYIFDDSFSALDFLTESRLRRALNGYLAGRSQIVITQRISTAMHCDRIYVLDQGKLVGTGTHGQLLSSCPVYREIYDSQLRGGL